MLESFFDPKSIILFGVSRNPDKSGHYMLLNVREFEPDNLYIIHPKAESISDIKCIKRIDEINEPARSNIDLAIISLPVKYVADTVCECVMHGVRCILIQSGNIGNSEDKITQKKIQITNILNEYEEKNGYRTRIIGPNSLGIFNNINGFFTGIMDFKKKPILHQNKNNLSIVAQTGLVVSGYFVDLFESQDVGISQILAIGNKFDVDECDVLEYLISDPYTKAIAFYLEGLNNGRRFYELCKDAIFNHHKIIILLNSGRSTLGQKAIQSHTNSLAANSKLLDGMSKQLGIIQVNTFPELILAGKLATNISLPKGNNIGLISISGAGCVLSADFAEIFGFEVPKLTDEMITELKTIFPPWAEIDHPIDMWASIEQIGTKAYNKVIDVFLNSKLFDIIIFCSIAGRRTILDYESLRRLVKNHPDIPVLLQLFGGFRELKTNFSEELERPNKHDCYLPIVYNLESTFSILSKLTYLSDLKKRI
ncbi:MAG: hypothetical protein GF364_05495 [Candidatus Lokiarchaeota archaeon]|nr:hypothetical protein [Candidatus Lokiarchaeota archaeon]